MTWSQMFICTTVQDKWGTDKNIWGDFPVTDILPNRLIIFKKKKLQVERMIETRDQLRDTKSSFAFQ